MALFDVQVAMLANQAMNYLVSGRPPGLTGNAHPNIVPSQDFPTSDGRIAVAVGSDRQFARFADALGRADWASDARFATNAARVENREVLVSEITLILSGGTTGRWRAALQASGVPCGPIQTLEGVFADPQAQARGLQRALDMTGVGETPTVANPMRLSGTPPAYAGAPPRLGEHTFEVLRERLAVTEKVLEVWSQSGVVRDFGGNRAVSGGDGT